jgi:hypothetical protein
MTDNNGESVFKDFTNLYSVTKTLKFELKPYPKTQEVLTTVFNEDEIKSNNYIEMKKILNELHNHFIQESMEFVELEIKNVEETERIYKELKIKNKKRRENESSIKLLEVRFENLKRELRRQIVDSFNICSENWTKKYCIEFKDAGYKILTESKIVDVLKVIYKEDSDKLSIINSFENFWTYFSGFNLNKENYYSIENKSTGVASRCIDQNLIRFLDNKKAFEEMKDKRSVNIEFEKEFTLESFQNKLNQTGIDKFNTDCVAKINTLINEYNQKNKAKVTQLILLHKQIGSDKKAIEIFEIEKGKEWLSLESLIENQIPGIAILENIYTDYFQDLNLHKPEQIYFNKSSISTISHCWFKSWETLGSLLKKEKISNIKYSGGEYKIPKFIKLSELKEFLESYNHLDKTKNENEVESTLFRGGIDGEYKKFYEESAWETFVKIWEFEANKVFERIRIANENFEIEKKSIFSKEKHIELIKSVCDSFLDFQSIIKFHITTEAVEKNNQFNIEIDNFLNSSELDKYYNAFRNYLSKKPFNVEKIKLNFGNSTLLGGWDLNKESDNTSTILKNGDQYELVIFNQKFRHTFDNKKNNNSLYVDDGLGLKKMVYKLLPGPNKMLPKVAFSKKNYDHFNPSDDVIRVYKSGSFKKGDNFKEQDLIIIIDFWKNVLKEHSEWKNFNMKFKASSEYKGIDEFYSEVAKQGYKVEFIPINREKLEQLDGNEIYRFIIHNKDLQKYAKGKKNLETIYFENLFTPENLKIPCLKLNGEAEIFRRPKTENLQKLNKTKKNTKEIILKDTSKNELVCESQRYTQDKLFFHVPITFNFSSKNFNGVTKFNEKINQYIKNSSDNLNIIGIDRGEKHLLYYSVINSKGEILEQGSLNNLYIGAKEFGGTNIDFHKLLTNKQNTRNQARLNWEQIGNIKDLKSGYLSHVVHKLYQLVLNYNALVILEDLNVSFKGKRTAKVEKAVYQKFELALAKKLNLLVLKDKKNTEPGGVLNAYQLTPVINAGDVVIFERSKQWGNIFYVNANYTSAIDPITGWRKHIYFKNSETIERIQELFNPDIGIQINFDTSQKCYRFTYIEKSLDKVWDLYAYKGLQRFRWKPKNRQTEQFNLYEKFDILFKDYTRDKNINLQIFEDDKFNWKDLICYWNILNDIRNSNRDKLDDENDFIQSPVWSDKINDFYDSRKFEEYKSNFKLMLPNNGDANGAYNIARKGSILVNRINNSEDNKPDLFISNSDWDAFVSSKKPKLSSFFSITDQDLI